MTNTIRQRDNSEVWPHRIPKLIHAIRIDKQGRVGRILQHGNYGLTTAHTDGIVDGRGLQLCPVKQ